MNKKEYDEIFSYSSCLNLLNLLKTILHNVNGRNQIPAREATDSMIIMLDGPLCECVVWMDGRAHSQVNVYVLLLPK